jgi:3-oxoacyl-[acyl-carrier protein] reductase
MDLGLAGRTVIVTGGSGGIGRAIAAACGAESADVVITYTSGKEDAESAADAVEKAGGRALTARFTLADAASADDLVERTIRWTGRVDVLVNNAVRWGGGPPAADACFEDVPDDDWLPMIRDNVEGALRMSRLVAPHMRRLGWGRQVHISSNLAVGGQAGAEYYGALKAALHGFSRNAAFGLGRDGDILSNVVMPGLTRTGRGQAIADKFGPYFVPRTAIGRLLDADEVARAVVFLGSAANVGITGQEIAVTGGA